MTGLAVCALGADPGPVPGIFLARWEPGVRVAVLALAWQCPAPDAPALLEEILDEYGDSITCGQIEQFRTGRGAGARGRHADRTRGNLSELEEVAADRGLKLAVRHSSQVMPWASDKRLREAGLYAATRGKQHARAASRHALFCAVADGGLPDPLSGRAS